MSNCLVLNSLAATPSVENNGASLSNPNVNYLYTHCLVPDISGSAFRGTWTVYGHSGPLLFCLSSIKGPGVAS